jgi:tetratricopeptide (TPR) repeat protein
MGYGVQWNQQKIEQHAAVLGADYDSEPASPYQAYFFDGRFGGVLGAEHWESDVAYNDLLIVSLRRQWLNPGQPLKWASAIGIEGGGNSSGRWLGGLTLALSTPQSTVNGDLGVRLGHQEGPDLFTAIEKHDADDYRSAWYAPLSNYVDLYAALRINWVTSELSGGPWVRWQSPDTADYSRYGYAAYHDHYGPVFGVVLRYAYSLQAGRQVAGGQISLPAPERSNQKLDLAGHWALGRDLLSGKFYDDAAAEFNAVLEIDPKHVGALKALGYTYYIQGDRLKALGYYRRASVADPSDKSLQAWVERLAATTPGASGSVAPGEPF